MQGGRRSDASPLAVHKALGNGGVWGWKSGGPEDRLTFQGTGKNRGGEPGSEETDWGSGEGQFWAWVGGLHFLAKEIFMALLCVILKPWRASRAAPACTSLSNSTKAMSCRPGTSRTSLNPGN